MKGYNRDNDLFLAVGNDPDIMRSLGYGGHEVKERMVHTARYATEPGACALRTLGYGHEYNSFGKPVAVKGPMRLPAGIVSRREAQLAAERDTYKDGAQQLAQRTVAVREAAERQVGLMADGLAEERRAREQLEQELEQLRATAAEAETEPPPLAGGDASVEAFLDELHSAGYAVSSGHDPDVETLLNMLSTGFHRDQKIGGARWQGEDPSWTPKQTRYYAKVARQLGMLRTVPGAKKTVRGTKALKSGDGITGPGPRGKNHADSAWRDSLRGKPPDAVSLALIHAVMGGSRVHVFPQDGRPEQVIELKAGDILFMRGDLGHSGAGYSQSNIRIHSYIDSTAPGCEREPGLTFLF